MPEVCGIKLQSRFQLMSHAKDYSVDVWEKKRCVRRT